MSNPSDAELAAMMAEIETPPDPEVVERAVAAAPPVEAPSRPAPVKVGNETMLNRFIDGEQLRKDVAINPHDLDNAMMEHAALYVHYATQAVHARRQFERLKNAFEILEARLDNEYRTSLGEGAAKKPTEAQIRNALVADKRWSGAQAKVIEAQTIWKLCEVAQSSMEQRKDMILEVARDRRKEKEGQVRVLESQGLRDRVVEMVAAAKREVA